MGESMLGLVGVYASRSAVDADISAFMDEGHGFYVARSTVLARRTLPWRTSSSRHTTVSWITSWMWPRTCTGTRPQSG